MIHEKLVLMLPLSPSPPPSLLLSFSFSILLLSFPVPVPLLSLSSLIVKRNAAISDFHTWDFDFCCNKNKKKPNVSLSQQKVPLSPSDGSPNSSSMSNGND